MINVEYEGVEYTLRNTMSEITIEEMEAIIYTISKNKPLIDTWVTILSYMGLDQVLLDNLDYDSFIEIVKSFDFTSDNAIQKEIEIDGIIYSCYKGDEFKLKIKTLNKILDVMNKSSIYIAKIASILYTRGDYSEDQNYDKEHLKYKEEFFKNQPVYLVMGIITKINDNILKKISTTGGI